VRVGGWGKSFLTQKKMDGGHKEKKSSKTKIEIRVEKGKENKINLATTLVSTMREKNPISAPWCTCGC
jgi:hypothetical protein